MFIDRAGKRRRFVGLTNPRTALETVYADSSPEGQYLSLVSN